MKQNIIMIIILIALFLFGLVIYDFSDELDTSLTSHKWHLIDNEKMTVINFNKQKFSYYYKDTEEVVSSHEMCKTYRFNKSINVIKLNCNVKANKLYISSFSEDELKLTIDGVDKIFYRTEEMAKDADFIEKNNLTKEDFNDLMKIDLNKFTITTTDDIVNLYKSKNIKLIAFASDDNTIKNALNLKALYNITSNSNKSLLVIDYTKLTNEELASLVKLNNDLPDEIKNFNKSIIPIYIVGNKSFELVTDLEINAFSEVNDYNNI